MCAKRTNLRDERVNPHPAGHYIAERTQELALLARYDGCEDLAYMLELASIEAENMGGAQEGCNRSFRLRGRVSTKIKCELRNCSEKG
jgi:hypothetical protein